MILVGHLHVLAGGKNTLAGIEGGFSFVNLLHEKPFTKFLN